MIIHDTHFKKVYPEGIEFKGGEGKPAGVLVKQYLKNRAVDIPKIEEKIDTFDDKFDKIIEIQENQAKNIRYLAENINTHIPAVKKLGDGADRLADEVEKMNKPKGFFNWIKEKMK